MTNERARDLIHDLLLWRQAQQPPLIEDVTSSEDLVIFTDTDGDRHTLAISTEGERP